MLVGIEKLYQGKVVAYKDEWVREFNSVKECRKYFAKVFLNIKIENISAGIRRVLNGKRKTYHKYIFVKGEIKNKNF